MSLDWWVTHKTFLVHVVSVGPDQFLQDPLMRLSFWLVSQHLPASVIGNGKFTSLSYRRFIDVQMYVFLSFVCLVLSALHWSHCIYVAHAIRLLDWHVNFYFYSDPRDNNMSSDDDMLLLTVPFPIFICKQ